MSNNPHDFNRGSFKTFILKYKPPPRILLRHKGKILVASGLYIILSLMTDGSRLPLQGFMKRTYIDFYYLLFKLSRLIRGCSTFQGKHRWSAADWIRPTQIPLEGSKLIRIRLKKSDCSANCSSFPTNSARQTLSSSMKPFRTFFTKFLTKTPVTQW